MKTRETIHADSTATLINHLDSLRRWYETEYKEKSDRLCAMEDSDFGDTKEGRAQMETLSDEIDLLYATAIKIDTVINLLETFQ